jgi:predicted dehydrogenase
MGFPEPEWVLGQTFNDFRNNPDFKGSWGTTSTDIGTVDVETASHAFVRFKTGQIIFMRTSWAEMNKREEFSVTFQGTNGGGMTKRLFGENGDFSSAIDVCEIYRMENHHPINKQILTSTEDKMGGEKVVHNFVNTISGEEEPLSNPAQAVKLMKIIDAIYESANTKSPVKII